MPDLNAAILANLPPEVRLEVANPIDRNVALLIDSGPNYATVHADYAGDLLLAQRIIRALKNYEAKQRGQ